MVTVRSMECDDHQSVNDIICVCFRWLANREGFNEAQLKELLADRTPETLEKESTRQEFLVASIDGNVVGVVSWYRNELAKLYVNPTYHRRGIGTQLFQAAERALRHTGHREMRLHAPLPSVPFYQAMGMTILTHQPWRNAIFDNQTVVVMMKSLAQIDERAMRPLQIESSDTHHLM